MRASSTTTEKVAGRLLVVVLAQVSMSLSLISGFILMIVTNLGAHGPSFGEFLVEMWPLPAALVLAGLALWAAVRSRVGLGLLAVFLAAVALTFLWWPIIS